MVTNCGNWNQVLLPLLTSYLQTWSMISTLSRFWVITWTIKLRFVEYVLNWLKGCSHFNMWTKLLLVLQWNKRNQKMWTCPKSK